MTRAGIYCRISQDRDGTGLGVERQQADCEKLATTREWTVAEVYVDNDVSATTGRRRPAYERLLADAEAGTINAVVVWSLDRLHRRPVELEAFIDLADRKHLKLANVAGDVDLGTPAGRLHARMMGAVAKHEVEQKSARQKRAGAQAAQLGKPTGGPRPFGYQAGGLKVDRVEARQIRDAYRGLLAGVPLRELCRRLNDSGVRTSLGKRWSPTQLRAVLLRARNAGLRTYAGEVVGPAQWAAIVDESTWRAACALLADPGRRTSPGYAARYLLSGLALCGGCGATVTSAGTARVRDDGSRRTVYRCRPGGVAERPAGRHVARDVEPVDELVTEVIIERLSRKDAAGLLVPADTPDSGELAERAQALRVRLDDAAAAYADGDITNAQLRTITGRLRSQLEVVEREQAGKHRDAVLVDLVNGDPRSAWARLSLDRRRAVVDALCTVTLLPEDVRGARMFNPELVQVEWRTT